MKPKIALVGLFQSGKSTLVNCILKKQVAEVGIGLSTTHMSVCYQMSEQSIASWLLESKPMKVYPVNSQNLLSVDIIDTPGIDANDEDTEDARNALNSATVIILVITKEIPLGNREFVEFLINYIKGKNYIIILNCGCGEQSPRNPEAKTNQAILEIAVKKIASLLMYSPIYADCFNALEVSELFFKNTVNRNEEEILKKFAYFINQTKALAWYSLFAELQILPNIHFSMGLNHFSVDKDRLRLLDTVTMNGIEMLLRMGFKIVYADFLDVVAIPNKSFWRPPLIRFRFDPFFTDITMPSAIVCQSLDRIPSIYGIVKSKSFRVLNGKKCISLAKYFQIRKPLSLPIMEKEIGTILETISSWEEVVCIGNSKTGNSLNEFT